MKKLLLLLLSAITYGQDMYLDHSFINALPVAVGDTLSIKFNTIDNNNSTYKLLQFDYQYNNKLLQKYYEFIKLYNNNYRPIYHLEKFTFDIIDNLKN